MHDIQDIFPHAGGGGSGDGGDRDGREGLAEVGEGFESGAEVVAPFYGAHLSGSVKIAEGALEGGNRRCNGLRPQLSG